MLNRVRLVSTGCLRKRMTFLNTEESYKPMPSAAPIRLAAALSFALCALLAAQSPPAAQTKPSAAIPSSLPATQSTQAAIPSEEPHPHHALVTYTSGALSVSASDSSLNQILRDISRETGIHISGGVADERVFGHYGPDTPDKILAVLLDGTGSNMLLVHTDAQSPGELILTPRQGGPTPPNPNVSASDDAAEDANAPATQPAQPNPAPQSAPGQYRPGSNLPATPATTPGSGPAGATQPESPNGVKTPQQIYEQLQLLRQQQTPPKPQ